MIDSSAPVEQPVSEQAPPVEQPVVEQAAAPVEDTLETIEADLEANAIEVPDGDKLVPLSAVTRLREKLKDAKQGTNEAVALKQQLEAAQAQNAALAPLAEAFKALQAAPQYQQPQQQPPAAQQPTEDVGELEAIAKDFDFYKTDGTPDLDKARRVQARTTKQATQIAQAQTAPLVQNTLAGRAQENLARAKATTLPGTTEGADPQILDSLVSQIASQPNGLETLANPDAMKQIWLNAFALTHVKQRTSGAKPAAVVQQPAAEKPAPPVFTERPGGQMPQPKELNTLEKKAAKEAGLSEKEYLDMAKGMKW